MVSRSIIFFIGLLIAQQASGQIFASASKTRYAIGIHAGLAGFDSRLGAEVTTPVSLNRHFAFRLKASRAWSELYRARFDRNLAYYMAEVYFVYATAVSSRARVFGEAGPGYIMANKTMSRKNALSGNTSCGIELLVINEPALHISYAFAAGYIFSKAKADKIESSFYYAKGLVFNTGFRLYF